MKDFLYEFYVQSDYSFYSFKLFGVFAEPRSLPVSIIVLEHLFEGGWSVRLPISEHAVRMVKHPLFDFVLQLFEECWNCFVSIIYDVFVKEIVLWVKRHLYLFFSV